LGINYKLISLFTILTIGLKIQHVDAQAIRFTGFAPVITLNLNQGNKWTFQQVISNCINPKDYTFGTLDYPAGDIRLQLVTDAAYHFNQHLTFSLGFMYASNFPFDTRHTNEYRPYQQLVIKHSMGQWKFRHRLRLNQRLIENKQTSKVSNTNMFQYLIGFRHEIFNVNWYATGYIEPYITLSGPNKFAFYNEFWGNIGLGHHINNRWGNLQLCLGYEWLIRNKELDIREMWYPELTWILDLHAK